MKNEFEVRGDVTVIFIHSPKYGKFEALIDTVDLEKLVPVGRVYVWKSKPTDQFYVHCKIKKNNHWQTKKLHRLLMGEPKGSTVDHINHDTLDNRRSINLRTANKSENGQNRRGPTRRSKSGIRGVYFNHRCNKWEAQIRIKGKLIYLGLFTSRFLAEKTVVKARKELMPYSNN